ncbi:hypothetical protein [Natronocalculus amylovorans]|uniref:Uncharacterized protein n=1 Tax=Natronocalculus amylovorans TaxID=2917812 RepID=A0AAE3K8G2_9EURY|nr:hypothetical protein [Natronocalculus amylovorans]MCL9817272.1 hypothetical protein [Natronocalculus amylovorans]
MNRTGLHYLAGALALAVAAVHLYWGFPRLVTQIEIGMVHDPRPITFVLSSVLIIFGITRILDGHDPKQIYLFGMVLMATYIVGYAAWHTVLGHGAFWPWGPGEMGGHHDTGFIETMVSHLAVETTALISKILETATLIVLGILYATYDEAEAESPTARIPTNS